MWLIEKNPYNEKHFLSVNLDNVAFISMETEKDDNDSKEILWVIKFSFITEGSLWVKWWFKHEKDRNKYLTKIYEKLPRLNLDIDDITL